MLTKSVWAETHGTLMKPEQSTSPLWPWPVSFRTTLLVLVLPVLMLLQFQKGTMKLSASLSVSARSDRVIATVSFTQLEKL